MLQFVIPAVSALTSGLSLPAILGGGLTIAKGTMALNGAIKTAGLMKAVNTASSISRLANGLSAVSKSTKALSSVAQITNLAKQASNIEKLANASLLVGGGYELGKAVERHRQRKDAQECQDFAEAEMRSQEEAAMAELRKAYPRSSDEELHELLRYMMYLQHSA